MQFGRNIAEPPRIFSVNWFRTDAHGNFLWPGFGENMRVLKWIVERARDRAGAVESPLGWMPRFQDMDWEGLDFECEQFIELMNVNRDLWKLEILSHEELFIRLYDRLPKEMLFLKDLILSGSVALAGALGTAARGEIAEGLRDKGLGTRKAGKRVMVVRIMFRIFELLIPSP